MQTVLLGKSISSSLVSSPVISYCLERHGQNNERSEWIHLRFGSFVIGRSEDIVQYVETATGVSRAHLELMISKEGCTIKDLGSRNGTKLIGEEIAPYKEYPLSIGDTFTIAEQAYTLRTN
ncbi:FHA domain-containing protein FhaA [compost metagenome]